MLGHIIIIEEKGRTPVLERETVLGLPLLRASVPAPEGARPRAVERRVGKAARALAAEGVRRVLTEADFPWRPVLGQWGLRDVDPEALCQAMAAPLALAALEKRGVDPARATVALRGNRVSRPFFQAAVQLCARVRGLVVEAPSGGGALADHLRREYGVPVLEEGRGELTVGFSQSGGDGETQLRLYGPEPDLLGMALGLTEKRLPPEFDTLPLLAALWEEGRISQDELTVFANKLT